MSAHGTRIAQTIDLLDTTALHRRIEAREFPSAVARPLVLADYTLVGLLLGICSGVSLTWIRRNDDDHRDLSGRGAGSRQQEPLNPCSRDLEEAILSGLVPGAKRRCWTWHLRQSELATARPASTGTPAFRHGSRGSWRRCIHVARGTKCGLGPVLFTLTSFRFDRGLRVEEDNGRCRKDG